MQIIWHGKIVGSWIFGLTFIRYLLYVFIYVLEFLTSARNPVEDQILKFLIHHILILVEGATLVHIPCTWVNSLAWYSLHSLLIAIFHLDTITKKNNLTYHILNATQTFFCWSSNILTRNSPLLMLFIAIARTNSKYSYHYEKFEFLKYSYQKRMGESTT